MGLCPKISIIIPVYNGEQYLRECLDSVTGQTLQEIEILCVDDLSTDSSPDILFEYSVKDSRIRVFRSAENQGAGAARNLALQQAAGEYVGFMDADDFYPEPDTLEMLYSTAVGEGVKICGGAMVQLWEDGTVSQFSGAHGRHVFSTQGIYSFREYQGPYGFTGFIYLRTMLMDNCIYFPEYRWFEDPLFFVRAMLCAGTFYHTATATYVYRKGHKKTAWTFEKICDCIKSVTELLELAVESHLLRLYDIVKRFFLNMYFGEFFDEIKTPAVAELLDVIHPLLERFCLSDNSSECLLDFLRDKKIIIYGTGETGTALAHCLKDNPRVLLLGGCNSWVSEKGDLWIHKDMELPLYNIKEWSFRTPDATILIATLETHHAQIMKVCADAGFQIVIPIQESQQLAILHGEYMQKRKGGRESS